jgi:hypothetical protein
MTKIPVWATARGALHFVTGDFARILGVMWFPTLLAWGAAFAVRIAYPGGAPRIVTAGVTFLQLFLMIMQTVGLAQLALGLRTGPVRIYASVAPPVWRLIGSALLLVVVLALAVIAVLIGSRLLAGLQHIVTLSVTSRLASLPLHLAILLLILALWGALIYLYVRLYFFLLPAAASGDPEFSLVRSWQLGAGNFWRTILLILTLMVPLLLLEAAAFFWLLHGIPWAGPHAAPEARAAMQAAMNARVTALAGNWYSHWYVSFPLGLVAMAAIYGYLVGVHCCAYRALTGASPVARDPLP